MKCPLEPKPLVRKMAFAITVSVLLHSLPAALAQPNPKAPNRRPPPAGAERQGGQPQPGVPAGRALPVLERVLTEEQRETLHAAMAAQRAPMRSLEAKVRAARQALMRASLNDKFDEEAVRAKALEVGKLDVELAVLRAKALSQVQPPLSMEQLEKIVNPLPPREMDGPPDGPRPRRDNRLPPAPRDRPVAPKPDSQ